MNAFARPLVLLLGAVALPAFADGGAPTLKSVDFRNAKMPSCRGPISLKDGIGGWKHLGPRAELRLVKVVLGDLGGDPGEEAVLHFRVSGIAKWGDLLIVLGDRPGALKCLGAFLLIDVEGQIKGLSIENGTLAVSTLALGPDDARCCPSEKRTLQLRVKAGRLVRLRYGKLLHPRNARLR